MGLGDVVHFAIVGISRRHTLISIVQGVIICVLDLHLGLSIRDCLLLLGKCGIHYRLETLSIDLIVPLLHPCLLLLILTVRNEDDRVRYIYVVELRWLVILLHLNCVTHYIGRGYMDRVIQVCVIGLGDDGGGIHVVHIPRLVKCLAQLDLIQWLSIND